jgi:hypothetical protein
LRRKIDLGTKTWTSPLVSKTVMDWRLTSRITIFVRRNKYYFTHLFGEVKNFLCGAQNVEELQF